MLYRLDKVTTKKITDMKDLNQLTPEEWLNENVKPEDWNNTQECLPDSLWTNNVLQYMKGYAEAKLSQKAPAQEVGEDVKALSKEELIAVIANMHDTIQNWDSGYGLPDNDAKALREIGEECTRFCINHNTLTHNPWAIPKLTK